MPTKKFPAVLAAVVLMFALLITILVVLLTRNPGENVEISGAASTLSKLEPAKIAILEGGAFTPATIKIKVGTTVTWLSDDDDLNHKLVSGPHPDHSVLKDLSSPILAADESYSYTFKQTGTFKYHDEITPELGGTVIVTE